MDSTSSPVQPDGYNYHGVYYVSTFCYTETTTSQRGNETPTRTIKLCSVHAPELGREISPTSCLADRVEDGRLIRENRPISECEALGLYPESTFVGE